MKSIINKLKEYNPIVHEGKDGYFSIEVKNSNGDSLVISYEDEITVSFSYWHCHYSCEDIDDCLDEVISILNNKESILVMFVNDKVIGCGSSLDKGKYSKSDCIEFIKSFFGNSVIGEDGLLVKIIYWDSNNNYEMFLERELFS